MNAAAADFQLCLARQGDAIERGRAVIDGFNRTTPHFKLGTVHIDAGKGSAGRGCAIGDADVISEADGAARNIEKTILVRDLPGDGALDLDGLTTVIHPYGVVYDIQLTGNRLGGRVQCGAEHDGHLLRHNLLKVIGIDVLECAL